MLVSWHVHAAVYVYLYLYLYLYTRHRQPPRMPTRAVSRSQGGARPGSPGTRGPGLLSGPGPPPAGGATPHCVARGLLILEHTNHMKYLLTLRLSCLFVCLFVC
mgnify:CR=1 FL=1